MLNLLCLLLIFIRGSYDNTSSVIKKKNKTRIVRDLYFEAW